MVTKEIHKMDKRTIHNLIIPAEKYAERMESMVLPYLAERKTETRLLPLRFASLWAMSATTACGRIPKTAMGNEDAIIRSRDGSALSCREEN